MEHTIEELLLAAEVRRITADRIRARLPEGHTAADRAEAFNTQGNAVIAEVLAELGNIAALIKQQRAAR